MTLKDWNKFEDLLEFFGCSKTTLYAWINDGRFPQGAKTPGGKLWSREVIQRYLERGQTTKKNIDTIVKDMA